MSEPMAPPKILCVDDEPSILAALTRLLGRDFQVLTAASADEALDKLTAHPDIAVILSDQMMPGTHGLELLSEVRSRYPSVVRAILSGHINIGDLAQAINSGSIHRLILKPWDNEYLRLQMMEAVGQHRLLLEKAELEKLSITDSVTLLANHRHFHDRLQVEVERALRHSRPLSLVMIDIDHFKHYNDQFGHPAGDVLLRVASERFVSQLRAIDLVARYGGEEFAIILPETSPEDALKVSERLRMHFDNTPFSGPDGRATFVTLSLGISGLPAHGKTPKELIEAADRALYQAKRQGRNQSVAASFTPSVT